MDTIGNRLKLLRIKSGLTQPELAEKIGISGAQISRIETDKSSNLTAATISAYMNIFSVSADFILTGRNSEYNITEEEKKMLSDFRTLENPFKNKIIDFIDVAKTPKKHLSEPYVFNDALGNYDARKMYTVPVVGKVAAGLPIDAIENILAHVQTEIPNIEFALYAKGSSMEPVIHDGEIILVHKIPEIENGEIGIFQIDDEATCKIYHNYHNRIELCSFNPSFPPIIYLKKDLNSFQIIGKVILTSDQRARQGK